MTDTPTPSPHSVAIIGGGPAGLMAAEVLAGAGLRVELFDAMPSVGRKFLLAGVGGMNITHSEPYPVFVARYGERQPQIDKLLQDFDADALRDWIHGLGIETFVGTSGRVFPTDMKAAPLLRAWLKRLREAGVHLHTRHRWLGWNADGSLRLDTPEGERSIHADAVLLALGGGSWPRLGSDGSWVAHLQQAGVPIAPLQPSNCGFDVDAWSPLLREKFAGAPLKNVALSLAGEAQRQGEFVLTATGIEGSLVYALSAGIRQRISRDGSCTVHLDLLPQRSEEALSKALSKPRGSHSMAKHLHRQAGLDGAKAALLRELAPAEHFVDPGRLAASIKALPIQLRQPRPLEEAISSAGGVPFEALDKGLMLTALPGTFCAGEMLDWEAPTGGYLLTACFASGRVAGQGIARWLRNNTR
ncbi:aminoacetone oxidase family FAD-binding enzyme [Pseudomonas daroniae]|uniref:Aminoacetone oxidase family FAD-binding enzyme n=1 Tax=Phytopseudomonas daroniae TaxID=2487519 RepID=A0A4Q9QNU5_9GAMM|nr:MULTISPECIES: TIGR03862 family flavoprotein [Pseudomonas]TBU79854.1 aminoacetone oxidase family FAD-binding enzyme [Pseudomonas daroniae]TBU82427.1 aminoacetone oxidase family FAD-binding enzyme [Pseudomonas sp. FRB 228]TBU91860.1 aminoacetone oxidase family FAD-binding enzyme [Pseudomonas daroniae]